jgi:hypothetical protein
MSKSLSEQICEICGIKKKRITLWRNCEGCKYLIDNECKRGDNPCKPPYRYIFPDFENNNNNFVRLLEVLYKEIGLYDLFFTTDNNRKQLKSDILKTIVELLSNKLGYKIPLITKIKKIIRETDWEV